MFVFEDILVFLCVVLTNHQPTIMKIRKGYSFFINKYILFSFFGIISSFNGNAILHPDCNFTLSINKSKNNGIILYYVKGATYKSTFLYKEEIYSYIIDDNKNIMIFNKEGKQINLNLKLFIFTDIREKDFEVDEFIDFEPSFLERIVNLENYSKSAEPISINYKSLREDLNIIINRESLNIKETQYLVFRFDIDEDGVVNNARNETSDDTILHQSISNYLNKLENWQPSEISGEPATSVVEIKIMIPYNYIKKSEIIHEHKKIDKKE